MAYSTRERGYWIFKTVKDVDRTYRSIEGYDDDIATRYEYDSNVANYKQVAEGDIIVIINKETIIGFAEIAAIETASGQKEVLKCPVCATTSFEARKNILPRYRCNKGHEFDEPISEIQEVTKYKSHYGDSFIELADETPISILRAYYISNYNRNMSIQKLDPAFFENYFKKIPGLLDRGHNYLSPLDAGEAEEPETPYVPTSNDDREHVPQQIKARRGQKKFRDGLIKRYSGKCMVTGCEILHLLEAAHINSYKGVKDNHMENGLLLRADIHTLFDLNLLGIEPNSLFVYFKPEILQNGYECFHEQPLKGIESDVKPSFEALAIRWEEFRPTK